MNNRHSNFWIGNFYSTTANATAVDLYFSDKVTIFTEDEDFGSGIQQCLANNTAPDCDWDRIFGTALPSEFTSTSTNVGLVSYSLANDDETASPMPGSQARLYCDVVAHVGFPTYTLDTRPSSNILTLVRMEGLQMSHNDTPLIIHPDWFLAAWSVDQNGTVDPIRNMAQEMSLALPAAWIQRDEMTFDQLYTLHDYGLGQTMSMVNYAFLDATADSDSQDPDQPVFSAWATRHVWAYGVSRSRTSKLGVAVVSCGAACVIARLILGLFLGKREYSPVELLVAAFEHYPTGEFAGMEKKSHMAKVRYVMEQDPDGKPRFVPERHYMGSFRH